MAAKAKYRVVQIGGDFYPQRRGWFGWHYFTENDDWGVPKSVSYRDKYEASSFIQRLREKARSGQPEQIVVMEWPE